MSNPYKAHFKKMNLNKKKAPFPIKNHNQGDNANMRIPQRKKKPLPLGAVFGFLSVFVFILTAYWNYESIESLLDRIEVGVLGEANANSGSSEGKKDSAKQDKSENSAAVKKSEEKVSSQNPMGMTSEEVSLFKSLEDRKKQLDQREESLNKLESELQEQKKELEKRLVELDGLRSKIGNQLQERVSSDETKVNKLVEFYSNMKPQKAAKVFETMNEDLAVEILSKMKKSSAAEIMNLVEAEKAKRLSEKFAGYRKN